MKVIIASSNKGKIIEINKYLSRLGITAVSLEEHLGYDIDVEETKDTYIGNAMLKAKAIYDVCKMPIIADDSGVEIEAMPNELGVYTARYMGKTTHIDEKIDSIYKAVEGKSKNIKYVCSMYYYAGEGQEIICQEEIEGEICNPPRGENGFAYDKIFFHSELNKTLAQMSVEEKNTISHRAKALEKMTIELGKIIDKDIK